MLRASERDLNEEAAAELEERFFEDTEPLPCCTYRRLPAGGFGGQVAVVPFGLDTIRPEDVDNFDYMISMEIRVYRASTHPYLLMLGLDYASSKQWYGLLLDLREVPVGELVPRGHGTDGRPVTWSHHVMQEEPRFFFFALSENGAQIAAQWLEKNADAEYADPKLALRHSTTDRDVLDLLLYLESGADPGMNLSTFYLDGSDLSEYVSDLSPIPLDD